MKKFNERLVRLVAIDKPNKRQIYVHDDKHRDLIISTLLDMGFKTYQEDLSNCYVHLPIVIDTDDYQFHTAGSVTVMACACQCGAKVLNYHQMLDLIDH